MLGFIQHRRDGLARVALALGLIVTTLFLQNPPAQQEEVADAGPRIIQTRNAQFSKCTTGQKETKIGKLGCAVLLKPKVQSSSIRFLSSEEK